jgi:hypothetical protein
MFSATRVLQQQVPSLHYGHKEADLATGLHCTLKKNHINGMNQDV